VRRGQVEELPLALAEPLPEPAAVRRAEERLPELEPGAVPVPPRVEERQHALVPVRLRLHEVPGDRRREEARADEVRDPGAGGEEHREEDEEEDDAGAHVALPQAERDEREGDEEVGEEADREDLDLLALPRERAREVKDERDLRRLGRLELERAERDPALRAARRLADERHEEEQHDGRAEDRVRERGDATRPELEREDEQGEPDARREELALQVVELVVPEARALRRRDGARGVDHHRADGGEGEDRGEQEPVEGRRGRFARGGVVAVSHRASSATWRRKASPRSS
jgi:hypothetical protein